jgi:hypothetical protein
MFMVDVPDDMLFPSVNQFKVMKIIYARPDHMITFEDQDVFRQERWFRTEMRKLANWGRVEIINGIRADGRKKAVAHYRLTFNGGIFFEFLLNYHNRNREFL